MFSTLSILSIFIEIILAGILLSGAYTLIKRGTGAKKYSEVFLGSVFAFSSLHIIGVIFARLLFNLGTDVIMLQAGANVMLAAASLSMYYYLLEKGSSRTLVATVAIGIAAFALAATEIFPQYAPQSYDPTGLAVNSITVFLIRTFWVFSWLSAAFVSFFRLSGMKDRKERNLELISMFSALFIAVGYFISMGYAALGSELFVLSSWFVLLVSYGAFIIASVISPKDDIAKAPVNFLRTRILFKLIALFVLMIVLIVEAITLGTIAISRNSLEKSAIKANRIIAQGVADKVQYIFEKEKDRAAIISRLQDESVEVLRKEKRLVFIVDSTGRVVVHPDLVVVRNKKNMSHMAAVAELKRGNAGEGRFHSPSGEEMVGAFVPIPSLGVGVVAMERREDAFSEIRKMETNSLIFVIVGILATVGVGLIFAKDVEGPINSLIFGTEQIRRGNLDYRIRTHSIDEIGRLAREFNLMTASLKESQEYLIASEKLAALGTMAAGMAHEIKNPLVALRTFTQLIPIKWEDPEFRKKFTDIVPLEIERINKIAENLLKFGKPTKPEIKPVNVNNVLEEVLELLENQLKKNNVRIATKFATVPPILGDASQLSQAILNIILNAVQAMPQGGEIVVKSDTGHVIQLGKMTEEGFESDDDASSESSKQPTVFIEITDNGEGITEEKMKHLFDPFYTTKPNGTGMGLPITLRIIEDHKGSVKVRSNPGKGTTFIIMLPAGEIKEKEA